MSANIDVLIDKFDNFELIRDEIAAILLVEKENQKVLADAAGKDPALWDFDVFRERTSPWEIIEDIDGKITKETPLVNVYFDQMKNVNSASNNIDRQQVNGTFNIDVLAGKNHKTDVDGKIIRGDELAAVEAQRVVRLVRNILMSNIYTYIFTATDPASGIPVAFRGENQIVSERTFNQIQMFQPQINDRPAQHVVGARLQMRVDFLEFSPQITGQQMELISSECTRSSDGLVYFKTDADTT